MMTELLHKRAGEIAKDVSPAQTTLLIVANGTDLNENSAAAAKREAEKIRSLGKYSAVLNVYMEESPLVSDWRKLTKTRNVIVVPFFISDGLHSYEDIPRLLGIGAGPPERREAESKDPSELPSGIITGSLDFARDVVQTKHSSVFRSNTDRIDHRSV